MKKPNVLSVLEEIEAIEKIAQSSAAPKVNSTPDRLEESTSSVLASLDHLATAVAEAQSAFQNFAMVIHEAVETEDSEDSESEEEGE